MSTFGRINSSRGSAHKPEVDIYGGFTKNLSNIYSQQEEALLSEALKVSSYGKRNTTPRVNWIGDRLKTAEAATALARPATAIRGVGFASDNLGVFDPFNQAAKKTVVLEAKKEDTPEQKYKNIEKKIFVLLEESIIASTGPNPDTTGGLVKAKEASSLDRTLLRIRNQNGGNFTHNFDLTFSVLFNLANLYYKNEMYIEALNTYTLMTKNKMFPNVNRLKINMGNIYFNLGLYSKAIKMFRMALDQVPSNQKELRLKITHNIGILFVKMGQYSDAATSFEFIMSEKGDIKSGLHLVLCYYALGDVEKMKKAFQLLLDVPIDYNEEDKLMNSSTNPSHEYIYNIIQSDELYQYEQKQKSLAQRNILITVNLISSVIENNFNDGYTWCVEAIKYTGFSKLATELEINKALIFLKLDDVGQAIDALKYFERKESSVAVNAAINLTFIYLLKKDLENAEKYAESARKLDSYNPAAFVNSGVCELVKEKYDVAKFMFSNALEIDATLFEALYNMGLLCKKTGDYEDALSYFNKLAANLGHLQHPEVIYQIANTYEMMGDVNAALESYHQLLGIVQLDAGILKKVGELYEMKGDRQQAFHYHLESHRIYPIDFTVVDWLGSHFIELQIAEKAIGYFEKAALNNPNDSYFLLRVAGCYRRIGNSQKSLQLFQKIHDKFPENTDCLRALIHLTQTQGLTELNETYNDSLEKIEKQKEVRQRINSSRPGTSSYSARMSAKSNNNIQTENNNRNTNSPPFNSPINSPFSYSDPLEPMAARPYTGMRRNTVAERDSDDDINTEDLLPM